MGGSSLTLWGPTQRKSLILQCVDSHLMRQRTTAVDERITCDWYQLAGLANMHRPGTDDQDFVDVSAFGRVDNFEFNYGLGILRPRTCLFQFLGLLQDTRYPRQQPSRHLFEKGHHKGALGSSRSRTKAA